MKAWLIGILWLGMDQLTKYIIPKVMNWYESIELIPGLLNITLVKNYGAAFGILKGSFWLFIPVALGFIVFLIVKWSSISQVPFAKWAAPLAGAGALGNVIDRLFLGYVVDFIDVPFFSVFNIADIGIFVGITILVLGFYLDEKDCEDRDGTSLV